MENRKLLYVGSLFLAQKLKLQEAFAKKTINLRNNGYPNVYGTSFGRVLKTFTSCRGKNNGLNINFYSFSLMR